MEESSKKAKIKESTVEATTTEVTATTKDEQEGQDTSQQQSYHPSYIQFNYIFVHYGDKFLATQSLQSVCMPLIGTAGYLLFRHRMRLPPDKAFDHSLPQEPIDFCSVETCFVLYYFGSLLLRSGLQGSRVLIRMPTCFKTLNLALVKMYPKS